jgi:DNA-binding transcriptional LysR family regulator
MFWSSGLYPQVRLSIKALRYFLVAAERGSIARSAVASAIESTEQEFKLKLVQRFPAKGIKPTAAGATLMHKIRRLIEEYDTLFLEGTDLRMALSGSLAVGYYAPVAPTFMPDIVGPLVRGNPEVRLGFVECDNEGAQSGLLDGKFDAILFVAENVRAGIAFETLLEAPPYLLAHRDHPLARSAAPLVALASTTEMVRSLVGAGIGCSILNMRPATQISYAGDELIAIPIRDADRPLKLVLGTLGGNPRRLVQAFSDACRAHFARPAVKDLMTCRVPS